jgi:hypothetical protein
LATAGKQRLRAAVRSGEGEATGPDALEQVEAFASDRQEALTGMVILRPARSAENLSSTPAS